MAWYGWLVLAAVLGGAAWLWAALYGEKSGAVHCVGCGKCVATGECVLKRGTCGKNPGARLDKQEKKDIISGSNSETP
ncbi:hypothetical protein [uncultured Oscillibacter sp.]|uniref:hypothetical protein n=1 Tax=uncultured Oscillibacter sp. TaxID=876091 RepID=UPI0025D7CFF0|nr:hypothetical protein [uncultured Oscillibacter sp.]